MPNINKVIYGNTTLIDLTDSTLSSTDQLAQGITAYDRSGTKITGTASGGGSAITVTEEQLSGGGTAKHITAVDISNDTVDAAHLAQGYTAHAADGTALTGTMTSTTVTSLSVTQNGTYTAPTGTAYSPVTVNVSGGGGSSAEEKQVNFIDYDGTILHSYTAAEANALTELPSNPSHSGLTAQGWNWTLAQIKAQLTAVPGGDVWVGQMYVTDDGKTRLYCHFSEGMLSPYLRLAVNGSVTVDWGDSSATDTLTGTTLSSAVDVQHTYSESGDYVITLTATSGTFAIVGSSNASYILNKQLSSASYVNIVATNALQRVEIGVGVSIGNYAFSQCTSMKSITLPSTLTSFGDRPFYYCYSLVSLALPIYTTSVTTYFCYYCTALEHISIPSTINEIASNAFYYCFGLSSITVPQISSISSSVFGYCYSLSSLVIPSTVTEIYGNAFISCYCIASLTIPSEVASIAAKAFSSMYGISAYHFLSETPPTLGSTNVFQNIQSNCVIYVPYSADHSVLEAYQTETNWSTFASYMQEEPT